MTLWTDKCSGHSKSAKLTEVMVLLVSKTSFYPLWWKGVQGEDGVVRVTLSSETGEAASIRAAVTGIDGSRSYTRQSAAATFGHYSGCPSQDAKLDDNFTLLDEHTVAPTHHTMAGTLWMMSESYLYSNLCALMPS